MLTIPSLQGANPHGCLSTKLGQSMPPYFGFIIIFRWRSLTASGPHVAEHLPQSLQAVTLQSRAENARISCDKADYKV